MSSPKDQTPVDGSFSTFMFGLTLGIAGALLLGTEEGRKTTRQLLKSLSSGLEKNEDLFQQAKSVAGQTFAEIENRVRAPQSYLPDETPSIYRESPPPPAPYISRPRSAPTYFESQGESLKP